MTDIPTLAAGLTEAMSDAARVAAKLTKAQQAARLWSAVAELDALAALIERPPLDDVQLEQDAALRIAAAIRTVRAHLLRSEG